jgi:predicted N-acyltransferase
VRKLKIHTSYKEINQEKWQETTKKRPFAQWSFLKIFQDNHNKNITHIFVEDIENKGIAYGQKFTVGGNKIKGYQERKSLISRLIHLLKINVVAFGNGYISNISSSIYKDGTTNKKFLTNIIKAIKQKWCVQAFIFPDHFIEEIGAKHKTNTQNKLIKVEIDEDMRMDIHPEWKTFEDYVQSLHKKYRKRLKNVFKKSDVVRIVNFDKNDLKKHYKKMQELFGEVHKRSSFNPIVFNTKSYFDLLESELPKCNIEGYFLREKLIAFASELETENKLYSYFIGLDYSFNRNLSVYERILYQSIKRAIESKKSEIIFGRTAAEFKSNVGAKPHKSFIYIYITSPILRFFLKPILERVRPKKWTQRSPLKKQE